MSGTNLGSGRDPARPRISDLAERLSQRPFTTRDGAFLLALFAESRPDLALLPEAVRAQLIHMQFTSQLRQYRDSAPDAVDWILELDHDGRSEPVGRSYVRRAAAEHRLLDLTIRSTWRGRGLGSIVIGRLCADAARAGVPLRLTVWQANHGARRLYRRHGFVPDDAEVGVADDLSDTTGYVPLCWSAEGGR